MPEGEGVEQASENMQHKLANQVVLRAALVCEVYIGDNELLTLDRQ
jgi:hypothetical protein